MSDDIVARLRGFWQPNDTQSSLRDEAADEIERLRDERDEARRLLKDVVDMFTAEHDALRAERDEARRRNCELLHEGYGRSPEEWAERKGWDCFKENKENTDD